MTQNTNELSPADVQEYLKGLHYPVHKPELIRHAQQHAAPKEMLELLRQLPDDKFECSGYFARLRRAPLKGAPHDRPQPQR
jgi:hypothetical protein